MLHPSASSSPTMASTHETHENRRSISSQSSNPDSSAMSFESSFRLESGYPGHDSNSEKHPKGKRKRTTSQDKAILEAAYNSNPKPDKAARLDIVSRVSLNEKEVQIWFQNRRQNDRRKSRPLSPQEIAALRYGGGVQILSSDSVPAPITASKVAGQPKPVDTHVETEQALGIENIPSSQDATSQHSVQSSPKLIGVDHHSTDIIARPEFEGSEKGTPPPHRSESDGQLVFQGSLASTTHLSNRRSFDNSFSTPSTLGRTVDDSFRLESFSSSFNSAASSSPASVLPPPSSSSSSQVRLSLSLDGKAELVSSQPSPPHPAQLPLPGDVDTLPPVRTHRTLHRSRSALPGITLPPISTLTAHLPPQLTRGRSRDVHAWESCCEADTRDELTKQAENESSGSAVAAISLLRSSSSSASLSNLIHSQGSPPNVLQSNPNKRNAPQNKPTHREGTTKKAKLSRATSSVARMQSLPQPSLDTRLEALDPEKKPGKGGLSVILSPSGDSDKENWSPDEEGNPQHGHRRAPPAKSQAQPPAGGNPRRVGRVLGEQDSAAKRSLLFGNRANTAPSTKAREAPMMIFEDMENSKPRGGEKRDGPEVDKFMRGEVSPSKRGDMDCVAGLLSLSQGNWR